jgi:hypothetical protein
MRRINERKLIRRGQWSNVVTLVSSLGAFGALVRDSPDWLRFTLLGIALASSIYAAMLPTHPRT